jgi:tetratricopeptide (TPR) repeat protein
MVEMIGSLFLVVNGLIKNGDVQNGMPLQLAVLAGLVVLMVHGLVDDALYGMRGTPLLFLIPGIGVALRYSSVSNSMVDRGRVRLARRSLLWGSALVVFLAVTAFGLMAQKPIVASWYANLGSIYLAKAELYDFPSGSFEYLPEEGSLEQAKGYFMRALLADSRNTTANYRLGIIASEERDFQAAIPYLETAFQENNRHRGIQKVLGYNYAWTAQPGLAAEMLAEIPEARQELEAYIWWWEMQGRSDLAVYDQSALSKMSEQSY